ncbi:MAG: zinc-binding alcohol dehydrogenase family protein, partial [Tepidisphaerales bacterium]
MMSVTKVGDGGLRIIDEIRKKVVPMRPAWIAALFLALLWPSGTPAATPKSMRVIVEQGNGGPEVLSLRVAPVLVPATGEVLIRVYAASVNPADTKIRRGLLFQVTQPIVPGMDVAGVIEKVGAGVRNLKPGEPVWAVIGRTEATSPRGLNGGYAEFVIVSAARVMPKPRRMTYAQAAGVGVAGLAAARYLEPLKLGPGKTLLITGVAGGVGSVAAQIAKAEGARVIGTATAAHNEYLRSIGVDRVIDYSAGPFEEEVHAVDAVFDT